MNIPMQLFVLLCWGGEYEYEDKWEFVVGVFDSMDGAKAGAAKDWQEYSRKDANASYTIEGHVLNKALLNGVASQMCLHPAKGWVWEEPKW